MRKAIAFSTILVMGAALASASVAEARFLYSGGGGARFHRHRHVIIEQQPAVGLGLGVGLLGLLMAQQSFAQPAQVYEEPAPQRFQRLPREPKLRDNPIPLK